MVVEVVVVGGRYLDLHPCVLPEPSSLLIPEMIGPN